MYLGVPHVQYASAAYAHIRKCAVMHVLVSEGWTESALHISHDEVELIPIAAVVKVTKTQCINKYQRVVMFEADPKTLPCKQRGRAPKGLSLI